jgi:hypothetical protein
MSRPVNEWLQTVRVMESQQDSGLQVFGLRWQSASSLRYATLDEAMSAGSMEVTEVNESGSVPTLKASSTSEVMSFLMAGEQLVGAKQNRVLNVSLMVPPAATISVPVSCVEAGRWSYRSPKFSSGGSMSHGHLRKMLSSQTHGSYRSSGAPRSDQGAVWGEVSRKLSAMGSSSAWQAFDQVYRDHHTRLEDLLGRLHPPEGCHGVIFAVAGQIAGADLFDQAATLVKLWPKLVRAFALDVLEAGQDPARPVSTDDVRRWVLSSAAAQAEPSPPPGWAATSGSRRRDSSAQP